MGNCASINSSSEIHDDTYGQQNAVYYRGDIADIKSQLIGSVYSHAGIKGINQDSAILFEGYGIENGAFGGVFDGHGKNGHIVSKMVRNKLPCLLLSQRNSRAKINQNEILESFYKWKEACLAAFKLMDKEIKMLDGLDCSSSGTTASVIVKQGDELLIANLGDSRVVLGTRNENGIMAVQLTTDLKPGVPCEAERIRKCNGRVLALQEEPHIQRVWLPYDDSPGLAMSRAFGDFVLKNHGIIATPDVSRHQLSLGDEFLVLATDGVWDVLSNDEVISIVSSRDSEEEAAQAVVDASTAAWQNKYPNSKRDDCTVICLFLRKNI